MASLEKLCININKYEAGVGTESKKGKAQQ